MMGNHLLLAFIIGSVMIISLVLKKLTLAGALTGGVLGVCVYAGAGFTGIALMGAFFILGTAATSYKKDWKQQQRIAAVTETQRTAGQVLANGGVAALTGLLTLFFPQYTHTLQVLLAASLASATADTLSSELGVVFGRRFYNIRTFKKDQRGLDGVVSWEGTLAGMLGSCVVAGIYALGFGVDRTLIWILIAGTMGNLADSFLGATLERAHYINNNVVNFLNTLVGAAVAWLLVSFF